MLRPSLISKLNDLCWGIVLLGEVARFAIHADPDKGQAM